MARVAPGPDGGLLWAADPVRPSPTLQSWRLMVVALAFSALLLVASASYSLVSVKRAAAGLQSALAALGDDLSATVPRSEIRELDDIAVGIGALARRLDEARQIQDRIGRDLAQQERLAALGRVVAGVAHEVRNPLASIKLRLDLAAGGRVALPPEARAAIDSRLGGDHPARSAGGGSPDRLGARAGGADGARRRSAGPGACRGAGSLGGAASDFDRGARARGGGRRWRRAGAGARQRSTQRRRGLARRRHRRGGGRRRRRRRARSASPIAAPASPRDAAGEIFEPFFTTKPDGTGLGLAISRAIARAHGGELTYARVGELTCLELALPRGRAAAQPFAAAGAPA